jgi:hypothetical protein
LLVVTATAGITAAAAAHASHVSTGAIVAAVLAGIVALACLAWALARTFAYEPRWSLSLRHAVAEAGFRASSTWEEFSAWVRSGR